MRKQVGTIYWITLSEQLHCIQTFSRFSTDPQQLLLKSHQIAVMLKLVKPCLLYTSPSPRDRG
eukprot:3634881-Amphidinium_carterae.1